MIAVLKDVLPCPVMRSAIVVLAAAVTFAGCGEDDQRGSSTIVAAFYPLAWAAERIAGDRATVVNLTPPGAEPHDAELSPRDVEGLRDAGLVLYVGGGFQPAIEDAVRDRDGPSLDVLGGNEDPHVWLDPVRFASIVVDVGRRLGLSRPARSLAAGLRRLDVAFRQGLARCARRTLVTTHAAFGHLAARYGLTQVSLSGRSPEVEPGPRELNRLVDEVRDSGATTVFAEPLVTDRLAKTVAREAGASVAILDPIEGMSEERLDAGDDYLSVMRENLSALRHALACR
jgi:zinc transport system substrate-binding protein